MIPMIKAFTVAAFFSLALTAVAFAKVDHSKIVPAIKAPSGRAIILKQDLFDRNNPNNLRADWPSPSAQPGQF